VGVGQEPEQRVVRELVPDDAIGRGPLPILVTIGIIPGAMSG
jgi:hypothetical protein